MRIVHVIPSLDMGGAEKLTINLALAQRELGNEVSLCCVMTPPEKGALYPKILEEGLSCSYSYSKHEPRPLQIYRFVKLLKRLGPDVVQSHLPRTNSCTTVAARLAGVRCIVASFHNSMIWKNRRQKKWGLLTERWQDGLFCDSKFIRKRLVELCPRSGRKTRVVYPSVSLPDVKVQENEILEFRKKWNIADDEKIVGIVARLAKVKDHDTFIDAAEKVLKRRSKVRFIIAGEGPRKKEIETRIREKNLSDKVLLAGFLPSLVALWKLMDLFVLTSRLEGFPVSLLEAFASGVPVVATNVGGIPEIVKPGQNGFLVDPGNPAETADRILEYLETPDLEASMKKNARATAGEFTIDKMARRCIELYNELSRGGLSNGS